MTEGEYDNWYAALCGEARIIADAKVEAVKQIDGLTQDNAHPRRLMVVNMTMKEWVARGK